MKEAQHGKPTWILRRKTNDRVIVDDKNPIALSDHKIVSCNFHCHLFLVFYDYFLDFLLSWISSNAVSAERCFLNEIHWKIFRSRRHFIIRLFNYESVFLVVFAVACTIIASNYDKYYRLILITSDLLPVNKMAFNETKIEMEECFC